MKRIQLPKKLLSALCAAALLVGAMPGALAAESTQQVSIQQQSIATNAGVFTYIDAQGGLWSWGHSLTGGVGNGTTSFTTGTPEKILDNVVFVSSGLNNNGAAIQSDGSLWTWGDNKTAVLHLLEDAVGGAGRNTGHGGQLGQGNLFLAFSQSNQQLQRLHGAVHPHHFVQFLAPMHTETSFAWDFIYGKLYLYLVF